MKVSIFIGSLKGGGAEKTAVNLAIFLSQRHQVELLQITNLVPEGFCETNNIKILSLDNDNNTHNKLFKIFKKISNFKEYLKSNKTDIYIGFLPANIEMLLFFKKFANAPIVFSERSNPFSYSIFHKLALRSLTKRANGAVFQTSGASNWYHLPKRIYSEVIPNAVNGKPVEANIDYGCNRIVSVGRLESEKNFNILIEAFAKIKKERDNLKLTIYGDGRKRRQLEKLRDKLGLTDSISFPGYKKDIYKELINYSIFVLPSKYEGMSNALIEAMASSLACIASNCPIGGNEMLLSNNRGILVKTGNVNELYEGIKLLIDNPKKAKELGINAKLFIESYSPEYIYSKWEKLIIKVAKRGKNDREKKNIDCCR